MTSHNPQEGGKEQGFLPESPSADAGPSPRSPEVPRFGGYIAPPTSWPRAATPTDLQPAWAGEFRDFNDWVSFATKRLTGAYCPKMGSEIKAVCIDNVGRRCTIGGHFMRARDEGTFPVRYFFDFAPSPDDRASSRDEGGLRDEPENPALQATGGDNGR